MLLFDFYCRGDDIGSWCLSPIAYEEHVRI